MIDWSFVFNVAIGIWLAISFFMAPAVVLTGFIKCREEGYATVPSYIFTTIVIVVVSPFIIAFEFAEEYIG